MTKTFKSGLTSGAVGIGLALLAFSTPAAAQRAQFWDEAEAISKVGHIVVIYEENRSFDSYFGLFPTANGQSNATAAQKAQVDSAGVPYAKLPPIINNKISGNPIDTRFPLDLPNQPFLINTYLKESDITPDPVHRYYQEQEQIHGGKMDRFAGVSDTAGFVMGYWNISDTYEYKLAQQYTLCDNFYHSAFGGSFLNHAFLIASRPYEYFTAPTSLRAVTDTAGNRVTDGNLTPDGYGINTTQSQQFHAASNTNPAVLIPPQTFQTIGDLLSAKGVTWKWYSGGLKDALAGRPATSALFGGFQFHHQPFMYFQKYAPGTAEQVAHIQDLSDFLNDISKNTLPQVVFYKPIGEQNLHPGYANITDGDSHLQTIITALQASPAYADMMIIITFDEHGGQWDHVAPPTRDRWGPGSRVPAIIISPFAKKGYVDHTQYDTGSILKTIEERFGLDSLTSSDASVASLRNTLQ